MMVAIPIDSHGGEGEGVDREVREALFESAPVGVGWGVKVDCHDGDDDGHHSVGEGLQARCADWLPVGVVVVLVVGSHVYVIAPLGGENL